MLKHLLFSIILAIAIVGNAAQHASADIPAETLPSLAPMIERVSPGVVNISVTGTVKAQVPPIFRDPFFRHFFGVPDEMPERRVQAAGSGVVIDAENGYVVTNHHVIANADKISIVLKDRRRLEAELVGSDPKADIALLKVQAEGLTEVPLGNSDALKVGDFVVAIGNPFGIGQTATIGMISALQRSGLGIEGYENFIQTDASINPGNSGGALVTQQGELVGINTAILSRSGGNIGISFAIPVNMVKVLVDQIVRYGEVRHGRLGVLIQDLTPDLAVAMGLEVRYGAVVSRVMPGTPAAEAGLQVGDAIVGFDGKRIESSTELRNLVGLRQPGERVELEIRRDGRRLNVTVTLGESER